MQFVQGQYENVIALTQYIKCTAFLINGWIVLEYKVGFPDFIIAFKNKAEATFYIA